MDHPGILVTPAITGNWATATGVQIVADVRAAINSIINQSSGVEVPNTVVMDTASFTLISTTVHLPGASDRTILSFLREAFPMIQRWESEPGMATVSATGGPSMLVYRNDQTRLRAVFPMMMMAVPPEQKGLSFVLSFETVVSNLFGILLCKARQCPKHFCLLLRRLFQVCLHLCRRQKSDAQHR